MTTLNQKEVDEIERRLTKIAPAGREWYWTPNENRDVKVFDNGGTIALITSPHGADVAEFIINAKNQDIRNLIDTVRALNKALCRAHEET